MSDDVNKPGNDSDELSPAVRLSRQGDELAARGSYSEAIAAYRESIEQDAAIFSSYLKLAMAQYQNAEYPAAEATLQKMVDLGPADRRPYTYREIMGFYLSFLQWDKAREAAEKCIALGVKDANHYLAQSVLAISRNEYEKGIEAAEESIKLDPSNAVAYYLLGLGYSENKQTNEAIAALEKSREIDPRNNDTLAFLASRYFDAGRYADSAAAHELLVNARYDREGVRQPGGIHTRLFLLARSYAYLKRFEKALDASRSALNYFRMGMYIAGLYDVAIETLEQIVKYDSDATRVRSACLFASYASAFAHRYINRMIPERPDLPAEPCLYWYEKALHYPVPTGDREPLELKIHYRAGWEYWRGKGNKEWWRPMLSEEDYWRLPEHEEACKAFERSVELYAASIGLDLLREDICPFEMLSASYVRTGRPGDAIDTLRSGLALISDNPSNGASRDLLLQIIIGNLDSDASVALSEVYEKLGEFKAAIECIVKPADLLIDYKKYAEAIALVERASAIAEEHQIEESQKIAEIRKRLEAAVGDRTAQGDQ